MKWIVIALLLSVGAYAECLEPIDGTAFTQNVLFCSSTYDVSNGITIAADDVVLDCGTAILRGVVGRSEIGIRAENVDNITIKNCNVITFNQGLYMKNVTNSLVENNAFLKNRIGIRLLDSFENTIRDNNDKSFQVAVSAINSKFNVVILGNKEIERAFCEVNACNEYRDMNVCEPGDFYCSRKCSPATDADCGAASVAPEPTKKAPVSVEQIIEEAKREVEQEQAEKSAETVPETKQKLPLLTKVLIYFVLYAAAFIVIRVTKPRKS